MWLYMTLCSGPMARPTTGKQHPPRGVLGKKRVVGWGAHGCWTGAALNFLELRQGEVRRTLLQQMPSLRHGRRLFAYDGFPLHDLAQDPRPPGCAALLGV